MQAQKDFLNFFLLFLFLMKLWILETLLLQVASIADDSAESEEITDTQKRREILSRRPSYR